MYFEEMQLFHVFLGLVLRLARPPSRAVGQGGDNARDDLEAEEPCDHVRPYGERRQVLWDQQAEHFRADDDVGGRGDEPRNEPHCQALVICQQADGHQEHRVKEHGAAGRMLAHYGLAQDNGQGEQSPDRRTAELPGGVETASDGELVKGLYRLVNHVSWLHNQAMLDTRCLLTSG